MSTMIAVYNSSGLVGRCDAKCYQATEPHCTCICGGANHGKGFKQAMDNTSQMAEAWLDTYAKEKGLESWTAEIPAREAIQLSLPITSLE